MSITISIVEDQNEMRESLVAWLSDAPGLKCVGAHATGANGYLLKNMPQAELVEAVQQVHSGGAPMSLQIARKVINHFHQVKKPTPEIEQLTGREYEILKLLAKGYMYKEIADQLSITMSTVRSHVCAVYDKLHVHSRSQ